MLDSKLVSVRTAFEKDLINNPGDARICTCVRKKGEIEGINPLVR